MKKPSLMELAHKNKASASSVDTPVPLSEKTSPEEERARVVVRLNFEAVEALEDIARERRREEKRAVPIQRLLEEAVSDLLRKHGKPDVVLPAPAKRAK